MQDTVLAQDTATSVLEEYSNNSLLNQTLLITGGTGSFGQKFTEIALKHNPRSIRIFSRGELLQLEMQKKFGDNPKLRFFIGDVRDKDRLYRACDGVDIIIHAAALKQVPLCEYNPFEAVQTNILGSMNVVNAAIDCRVEKAIAISSDKAVEPLNLYGATKKVMECLWTQANSYTGGRSTWFSCVRYGNVVASRGSVIPVFLKQRENGSLTITDDRMTRFWITLEQGVNFVIDSLTRMQGGEIFIPKIPSMKIMDLAEAISPSSKKVVTGIRSGEKMHEVLITEHESRHAKEFYNYFIIEPEHSFWGTKFPSGESLPEGFRYSSDTNAQWLSKEELQKLLRDA